MLKKDNVIDEMALDESSRETAKLHSKYLEIYSVSRLKLKQLELDFKVLLRDKFNHYNGKLSQDELDEKGWNYDPLNGLTVLKSDMDKYYDSDPVIQEHQKRIRKMETDHDKVMDRMYSIAKSRSEFLTRDSYREDSREIQDALKKLHKEET